MSEQFPYGTLGVAEDASFDEIQGVLRRFREEYKSDPKRLQEIEAAYDAVLMDRLRLRQEGKIKVPERIRFPEQTIPGVGSGSAGASLTPWGWLRNLTRALKGAPAFWPSVLFGTLVALSTLAPGQNPNILQVPLALGVGFSLFFLNRRRPGLGRAFLVTLGALLAGLALGSFLASWLRVPLGGLGVGEPQLITGITLVVLWLTSCFAP